MNLYRHRKRNRLDGYNYSQHGWYFVTVCTKDRVCLFGDIKNDEMILNEWGNIVKQQLLWLKQQYDYMQLDEFIIMPNHMHGILVINNNDDDNASRHHRRDRSRPVPTTCVDDKMIVQKIKSLSELMGAFKTTSSKIIHQNGLENFVWQRSFYDHIIRNEISLNRIRKYIRNNSMKWGLEKDRNHINNY